MDEKDGVSDRENRWLLWTPALSRFRWDTHKPIVPTWILLDKLVLVLSIDQPAESPQVQSYWATKCSTYNNGQPAVLKLLTQVVYLYTLPLWAWCRPSLDHHSNGQRSSFLYMLPNRLQVTSVWHSTAHLTKTSVWLLFPASSLTTLPLLMFSAYSCPLALWEFYHGIFFKRSMHTDPIISTSRAHPLNNLTPQSHKPSRTTSHPPTLHQHNLPSRRPAKPPRMGRNKLLIFLAPLALRLLHMPTASPSPEFLRRFQDGNEKHQRALYAKKVLFGLRRREGSVSKGGCRAYRWSV